MLKNILGRLGGYRSEFRRICNANGISLDYALQRDGLLILQEVFSTRRYSNYFPFYEAATIIDVGAHYGYFSIFAALNSDPEATIISVEPAQHNFDILRRNIRDSQVENVYPIRAAIAGPGLQGEAELYLGRSENASLFRDGEGPVETEKVRTITLDTLLQEQDIEEIDFLKMDCEGAEYGILLEGGAPLLDRIHTISLEFHDLKRPEFTGLELAKHLREHGFEIAYFNHNPTIREQNCGHLIATKAFL
ncbi:MAG: FkbM family methyltransferase [Phaeodactylibacter sp.]|nr:FkbM family methyltransferase [Phaeodactylibacter sp.]